MINIQRSILLKLLPDVTMCAWPVAHSAWPVARRTASPLSKKLSKRADNTTTGWISEMFMPGLPRAAQPSERFAFGRIASGVGHFAQTFG